MPFDFTTPEPLADAVDHLSAKTPIGSKLRTREWEQMPALLREQAQFSAGVESARALQRVHDALQDSITLARDPATGAYKMDRSKFVATLQKLANAEGLRNPDPEKRGTIQDFGSRARLELIYNTQIGLAQGKSFWLQGQDPDILDAFPAQELVRVAARKKPRNWTRRWIEAGGQTYAGRMIARKDDPIWTKLSRFGTPYPPFDFNSGMGVREIGRREAERLGVIRPDETITPQTQKLRDDLQASVQGLDPAFQHSLKRLYGDQIEIDGDTVKWKPASIAQAPKPDETDPNHPDDALQPADRRDERSLADARAIAAAAGSVFEELYPGWNAAGMLPTARGIEAQIAAGSLGWKPLYFDPWPVETSAALAEALPIPAEAEARYNAVGLFIYQPMVLKRIVQSDPAFYGPAETPEEIWAAIQKVSPEQNGELLGYGTRRMDPRLPQVRIFIAGHPQEIVAAFSADPQTAAIFAHERMKEIADITGLELEYNLIPPAL